MAKLAKKVFRTFMQPENAPKNSKIALKTLSQKRTMEKSLKALAELRNIIESVKIFSPTLYVALLIYNVIIEKRAL